MRPWEEPEEVGTWVMRPPDEVAMCGLSEFVQTTYEGRAIRLSAYTPPGWLPGHAYSVGDIVAPSTEALTVRHHCLHARRIAWHRARGTVYVRNEDRALFDERIAMFGMASRLLDLIGWAADEWLREHRPLLWDLRWTGRRP